MAVNPKSLNNLVPGGKRKNAVRVTLTLSPVTVELLKAQGNMSEAVDKLIQLCILGKVEHDGCLNPIPSNVEPLDIANDKPKGTSKNKYLLDKIEAHWGERLRFNETTQQVEMDGKALENIERVYGRLARELSLDIPKRKAFDFVVYIAKKYSYTP
jgi:hypothetical protein